MKKAVCISCTHHYHERIRPVETALAAAGYQITYITSDFSHTAKAPLRVELPNCIQIPTRPYAKNISPQRILSHICFAKDAMAAVRKLQPDLLYVEIPPNSLCRAAARYKKENPGVKLIFDVFDMWPESFPGRRAKQLLALPFAVWARFRNKGLPKADFVFTECDLYRRKLHRFLAEETTQTLYLCRQSATTPAPKLLPEEEALHLCYLGNINNIIDIPTIGALIGQIQQIRPVVLHIIGDGESRSSFIASVEATGAQVIFHGKIYDPQAKQAIFDKCSFGLNIMKSSVCVGLTMKSVDYFAGALPILNSIEGDTWELVSQRDMGINVSREDLADAARQAAGITPQRQQALGAHTLQAFYDLFTEERFQQILLSHL